MYSNSNFYHIKMEKSSCLNKSLRRCIIVGKTLSKRIIHFELFLRNHNDSNWYVLERSSLRSMSEISEVSIWEERFLFSTFQTQFVQRRTTILNKFELLEINDRRSANFRCKTFETIAKIFAEKVGERSRFWRRVELEFSSSVVQKFLPNGRNLIKNRRFDCFLIAGRDKNF